MNINIENGIISVYGVGKISVVPNIIKIDITIHHVSKTMKESQSEVNKIVEIILKKLEENNIENVRTRNIQFHPEYEYINSKRKYIGQKVEQNLLITIDDLEKNMQKAKDFLDNITIDIESINCNVVFATDNYEDKLTEARNLAYFDALEKAKQYSKLANLEIVKTIKISEFPPGDMGYDATLRSSNIALKSYSTLLPLSSIDITSKLYCDFLVK